MVYQFHARPHERAPTAFYPMATLRTRRVAWEYGKQLLNALALGLFVESTSLWYTLDVAYYGS